METLKKTMINLQNLPSTRPAIQPISHAPHDLAVPSAGSYEDAKQKVPDVIVGLPAECRSTESLSAINTRVWESHNS
jgi:hypothetical protein